ncbi:MULTISPECIES: hypothetical protein [Nostocaceae]|nr:MULTISPECIES: hypothetical protein [Nostocaceae]
MRLAENIIFLPDAPAECGLQAIAPREERTFITAWAAWAIPKP